MCAVPTSGRGVAGAAGLLAAFFVAGYTTILTETARRQLAGDAPADVVDDHRARVERLFEKLRDGFSG